MPTVTSKGRITIPKSVRAYLGLKSGSTVDFELAADGRVVLAATNAPHSAFARLRGSARHGMTTDQIMALTRGE